MTTNIKLVYESGNKAVEVISGFTEGGAKQAVVLEKPGDEFVACIHSDSVFALRETGDFRSVPADEAAKMDEIEHAAAQEAQEAATKLRNSD